MFYEHPSIISKDMSETALSDHIQNCTPLLTLRPSNLRHHNKQTCHASCISGTGRLHSRIFRPTSRLPSAVTTLAPSSRCLVDQSRPLVTLQLVHLHCVPSALSRMHLWETGKQSEGGGALFHPPFDRTRSGQQHNLLTGWNLKRMESERREPPCNPPWTT
jgi:hypothetical protein